MKNKLKGLFLSLLVAVSIVSLSACKKGKNDPQTPTVNVKVEQREFYAGEKLSDIEIKLTEGDTAGSIAWASPDTELVVGDNECSWSFTPTDTATFSSLTGNYKIVAVEPKEDPTINVSVSGMAYAETKLSTVSIVLAEGNTEGTLEWLEPDTMLEVGEKEFTWKFTPTDTETYKQVTGKIKVTAVAQTLTSISIKTPQTKTSYTAFELFDANGLVLTATYNAGKVVDITEGYEVAYNTSNSLRASDTYVTLSYGGKTCRANIAVSKISVETPEIDGTYVYSGVSITGNLKQTADSSLYTVSNNVYTLAGNHNITVTLKDSANYKWSISNSAAITVPFVINKAELVIQKNNYSGVFDGFAHKANVVIQNTSIYYSTTELTKTNYTSGSTTEIGFTNAGNHVVYYYVVGDENHNDAVGTISVNIQKASAEVSTNYCYSVVAGREVNVPLDYVSVVGVNGADLPKQNMVKFDYYTSYTDATTNTKTTSAQGASTDGGAPSVAGRYVVVTRYKENANYAESIAVSTLLIDNDDAPILAHDEERVFAWKTVSVIPSEVESYFEVKKNDTGNLVELVVDARIGDTQILGKAIKQDGVYKVILNGSTYVLNFTETADSTTVDFVAGDSSTYKTFTKWDIPYYLGTYALDTVTTDDVTPNSTMIITNDYGILKFVFTYYYVKTTDGSIVSGIKEGTITYVNSILRFMIDGEVYTSVSGVEEDEQLEVLSLTSASLYPQQIRGNYVRV